MSMIKRSRRSLKLSEIVSAIIIAASLGYILYKAHCLPHHSAWAFGQGRNLDKDRFGKELEPWELDTSLDYICRLNGNEPRQARLYHFKITKTRTYFDGKERVQTLVNGKYPGELIEANYGDEISVTIENLNDEPTSIHFHGLPMTGTNHLDGVPGLTQCEIPSGASFTYEFLATKSGTYWYHSHSGLQDMKGFIGPIVIHEEHSHTIVDQDMILLISDLYDNDVDDLMSSFAEPYLGGVEPVPQLSLLQGKLNPQLFLAENSKVRVRIINAASYLTYTVAFSGLPFHIIEADSERVFSQSLLQTIPVAVGQRYSAILWTESYGGIYPKQVTAIPHDDEMEWPNWVRKRQLKPANGIFDTAMRKSSPARNEEVNISEQSVSSELRQSDVEQFDSQQLRSYEVSQMPTYATKVIVLDVNMEEFDGLTMGVFNHTVYDRPDPKSAILRQFCKKPTDETLPAKHRHHWAKSSQIPIQPLSKLNLQLRNNDVVDILLRNLDDGPHTFHLHGHSFWVMERGAFSEHDSKPFSKTAPIKRDVVFLGKQSYVRIRFMANNPGVWLFHCHNMWHASSGMALHFVVEPEQLALISPPNEWFQLCQN